MLKVKDERRLQQLPVCVCVDVPSLSHFSPCSLPLSLSHSHSYLHRLPKVFPFQGQARPKCVNMCVSNNSLLMYECVYVCVCVYLGNCNYGPA